MTTNVNTYPKRKSRLKTILITVFVFLIVAAIAGWWYWNTHKNAIIKNELEKALEKSNDGFYKISYNEMRVDEDSGALTVTNMHLFYDSVRYVIDEKNNKAQPMLFNIYVPEINVVGVKTKKALLDKEIVGSKLEITNPVVNLEYTYEGTDSARNIPTREIYQQVLANLDVVQMDTVLIRGAQIITKNRKTKRTIVDVKDIDLSLYNVRIDSAAYYDSSRYLFAREIDIHFDKIELPSQDGFYNYKVNDIDLNSATGNLQVGEFSIIPLLDENAFVNAIPTQDDRFNFSFSNILLASINIDKLFNEYLLAESMTISDASFRIYRDLARPRDKKNRVGYYPHQIMDNLPLKFNVKKVFVRNSFVEYKERNHITRKSGKVQFYNVDAAISNFTNDKKAGAGETMKAVVNSSFLNRTPLTTYWTFYLFNPNGKFDVSGSVGAMEATALNSLAEPMGPASIKEGRLNGLEFNLTGTNHNMNGTLKVLYNDLKVALLELDKGETETDKKFLTSLLANMMIKNSNPKGNDEVRVAQVNYPRDVNRSMFNLCWKAMFQGIQSSLGIKRK
jgi:hypothetical protein